jgi:uncharacterized protein YidB (DUF937 family)
MSRGFPSMTALLGLLAVAGYQNRERLTELLGGLSRGQVSAEPTRSASSSMSGQMASGAGQPASSSGGILGNLQGMLGGLSLGGMSAGSLLNGGLGELVERFKQVGQQKTMDSWVGSGENAPIAQNDLEKAIGDETLDDLVRHTGLSRAEIVSRLARDLPDAVNQYTPDGRVPTEVDLARPS